MVSGLTVKTMRNSSKSGGVDSKEVVTVVTDVVNVVTVVIASV